MKKLLEILVDNPVWLAVFFIAIPCVLNAVMWIHYWITRNYIDFSGWLGFWGGYVGGVAAFCAIYVSYKQNERNHKKQLAKQEETEKNSVCPLLNVTVAFNRTSEAHAYDLINEILNPPSLGIVVNGENAEYCLNLKECCNKQDLILERNGRIYKTNSLDMVRAFKISNDGLGIAVSILPVLMRSESMDGKYKPVSYEEDGNIPFFHLAPNTSLEYRLVFAKEQKSTYYRLRFIYVDMLKNIISQDMHFHIARDTGESKFRMRSIRPPEYTGNKADPNFLTNTEEP